MPSAYTPFRGVRSLRDILLLDEKLDGGTRVVQLPTAPYYAEICAWVNFAPGASTFPSGEQMLLHAPSDEGTGWSLTLDTHGYLQFRAGDTACASRLPVHTLVAPAQPFSLGVSIMNYAWLLRDSPYGAEASDYGRLRLLASQRGGVPFLPLVTALSPSLRRVDNAILVPV